MQKERKYLYSITKHWSTHWHKVYTVPRALCKKHKT